MPADLNHAVIAIGSNIEPQRHVANAICLIGQSHRLIAQSKFVWTKPLGNANQQDFLNGAVLIETKLGADSLRANLRDIEAQLGRQRGADKFGPRTIDLDLVVWNGQIVHKDMSERDFVRQAVLEVLPELRIDGCFLLARSVDLSDD